MNNRVVIICILLLGAIGLFSNHRWFDAVRERDALQATCDSLRAELILQQAYAMADSAGVAVVVTLPLQLTTRGVWDRTLTRDGKTVKITPRQGR